MFPDSYEQLNDQLNQHHPLMVVLENFQYFLRLKGEGCDRWFKRLSNPFRYGLIQQSLECSFLFYECLSRFYSRFALKKQKSCFISIILPRNSFDQLFIAAQSYSCLANVYNKIPLLIITISFYSCNLLTTFTLHTTYLDYILNNSWFCFACTKRS